MNANNKMADVSDQRFLKNKKQKGGMRSSSGEETSGLASERDGDGSARDSNTVESFRDGNFSSFIPSNPYLSSVPVFEDNTSETISVSSTQHVMETLPLNSSELRDGITFNSIKMGDVITGIPPDPHGAAGPDSVISVVNMMIQSLGKDGSLKWQANLTNFFPSTQATDFLFDPKIVYDVHTNRFAVVTLAGIEKVCESSNILLAVSLNNNPKKMNGNSRKSHFFFLTEVFGQIIQDLNMMNKPTTLQLTCLLVLGRGGSYDHIYGL